MKKLIMLSCMAFFSASSLWAQEEGITQCGTPTGQAPFPLTTFQELPDPKIPDASTWKVLKSPFISWGSTDIRYAKHKVPEQKKSLHVTLNGWRGEKLHAQAIVSTPKELQSLNYSFSEFKNRKGEVLPAGAVTGGFVRYVLTDELNLDGKGGCGNRPDHSKYDSTLVADAIDHLAPTIAVKKNSNQCIWVSCQVPENVSAGTYHGSLTIKDAKNILSELQLDIHVSSRILPPPSQWAFHLDLWQNPFSVARYYQVPLWSKAHFEAMRPVMKMLADAGQKIITTSIMHKPWNGQTEDYFESMVTWTKKLDGSWKFDYEVFDAWVEFMMSLGIDQQINCYSMVPWELSFQYFDQATNRMQSIKTAPGEDTYEELWVAMLSSFSRHLREKGWFEKCMIAMDERPMEVMQKTLKVIRKADPEFKVALAGNYHKEIEDNMDDYCISIAQEFPEEVLKRRKETGKKSTLYTCCTEPFPNTFTFSEPAEAAWISFYCAKQHVDGYLRWAYNSWPVEPLLDSRFRSWAGGDTYLVYPGARTSIRFERLLEGIQCHEKITLLRNEFTQKGNRSELKKIEKMLEPFNLDNYPDIPAEKTVRKAQKILNSL